MAPRKPKPKPQALAITPNFINNSVLTMDNAQGSGDLVRFQVSSAGTPAFTIASIQNYCILCNVGCYDSEPECAIGDCYCACSCDDEVPASVTFTVEQSIEMFKAIREAFASVGDPQLHIIEETLSAIITAA